MDPSPGTPRCSSLTAAGLPFSNVFFFCSFPFCQFVSQKPWVPRSFSEPLLTSRLALILALKCRLYPPFPGHSHPHSASRTYIFTSSARPCMNSPVASLYWCLCCLFQQASSTFRPPISGGPPLYTTMYVHEYVNRHACLCMCVCTNTQL